MPKLSSNRRLPHHQSQVIDRSRPFYFRYGKKNIEAYQGDTVASALYSSGIDIFNRSFKYHRPRGLVCLTGSCPNCMMSVDDVPNVRACMCKAVEGMEIRHQNAWPSLEHDALSTIERFDRFMPVGFYYKTLIRPKGAWGLAEPFIRRIAGLGRVNTGLVSETEYEHINLYTDVAIVGGGPAGCKAAIAAASAGSRVVLIEEQPFLGGHLRSDTLKRLGSGTNPGSMGFEIVSGLEQSVYSSKNLQVLTNAAALGVYEGNMLTIHQGEKLIKLRSNQVIVAAGSREVPMVFPNNDLPGVLLSTGALRLTNLYGVSPGKKGVVVTNNDQGLEAALQLLKAGVEVVAVADSRPLQVTDNSLLSSIQELGISLFTNHTVRRAEGKKKISCVVLEEINQPTSIKKFESINCDFLCLSPGFEPITALLAQADCKLAYDAIVGEMVPAKLREDTWTAGDITGIHDLEISLLQGTIAGLEAAIGSGCRDAPLGEVKDLKAQLKKLEVQYRQRLSINPIWVVPEVDKKKFVCLCEDVTEKDVQDGINEGFADVQSLKRYSTVSMGPCQGKMCLKAYTEICARFTGKTLDETGSTTPRPPFRPTPMGVLAGPDHMSFRFTPIHHGHIRSGGKMAEVGQWKRPHSYGDPLEEIKAVRERVGVIDVSTLGKLDVVGRDAPALMDRIYTHHFSNLKVGRIRYGMICSDSGIIMDDGTVTRLAEDRYYVTTGTGNIDLVEEWFRWWIVGTGMCAHVANVTPGFAAINVAGPMARATLSKLTDVDISVDGLKYMRSAMGKVAGIEALLLRIGFVGETGWEIHLPSESGEYVWNALIDAGREFGISPFGVEAQRVLRLEKKHLIPGQDTDVVSNPLEADMEWAVKFEKDDFIGRSALQSIANRGFRNRMVGFVMENNIVPEEGVPVLEFGWPVGRVTSARFSPSIGRGFGLAWVPERLAGDGTRIEIRVPGGSAPALISQEPVYDPKGIRLRE